MSAEDHEKIVKYDDYCHTCKFKDVNDILGEDPCDTCLGIPVNLNSHKPIKYEEDKK